MSTETFNIKYKRVPHSTQVKEPIKLGLIRLRNKIFEDTGKEPAEVDLTEEAYMDLFTKHGISLQPNK